MRNIVLTESEKKQILTKHIKQSNMIDENIVITDWLSPDEKYMIFLDELYDIENKKKLGDIWSNPDNLVTFLEHSYKVSPLKQSIKEQASEVFGRVMITESNQDLTPLKPLVKEYLKEGLWDNFTDWVSDTAKSTVKGVSDFAVDSWEGIKDFGVAISRGDWNEIVNLLKKGMKWFARKLRQAVYSPVGLIVDAILVATGVGKGAQVVAWAIVVALDIYEFTTGDYEHPDDPMWMRVLFFGMDILGLVMAGYVAKSAKTAIKTATAGAKTAEEAGEMIAKNPAAYKALETMSEVSGKVPSMLNKSAGMMEKTFPKGANFVGNSVSKAPEALAKSEGTFSRIMKGAKAGAKTSAIVGGIGTAEKYLQGGKEAKLATDNKELAKALTSQEADYSQIFA
jgi:hypothetical protein